MILSDLAKIIDGDINLEVYDASGNLVFNDALAKLNIKDRSRKVLSIAPQHTSRANYLEVVVY